MGNRIGKANHDVDREKEHSRSNIVSKRSLQTDSIAFNLVSLGDLFFIFSIEVSYIRDLTKTRIQNIGRNGKRMSRKYLFLALLIAILVLIIVFSESSVTAASLTASHKSGVVKKTNGESFVVEINFMNTGEAEGSWSVNVVFEGDFWIWEGVPKNLVLTSGASETLTWQGIVPEDARVDSVARLVVYYDDHFKSLSWWLHVVSSAELYITSSSVK